MEPVKAPRGRRIYFDSNIFIYAFEGLTPFGTVARRALAFLDNGEIHGVTSELTLAECLVKPLERNVQTAVAAYEECLQSDDTLSVVPITREILVAAAGIRAHHRLRLPDAIHAATAIALHCDRFLTNDDAFSKVSGLRVMKIADLEGQIPTP